MSNSKGALIIISGPSGVGKSTVLERVMRRLDKVWFSVSATTRHPRAGERDGIEYFFVDREQFESMIEEGELLEYMEYAGNYYGTPKTPIEEHVDEGYIVILDVDVRGKLNIRKSYSGGVSVFIAPPSMEALEKRLRGRGTESEETIAKRLAAAANELAYKEGYDHIVVNNNVDEAAEKLFEIINAACVPNERM